jgi:hypothetical protein
MPDFTPSARVLLVLVALTSATIWLHGGRSRRATINTFLTLGWGLVLVSTLTPSTEQMMDQQITC